MTETENTPVPQPPAPIEHTAARFTQDDIDRIIAERLQRQASTLQTQFLSEVGADSVEGIKAALEEAKNVRDAQLTELERAQQEAQSLMDQHATLQAQHAALEETYRQERLDAALTQALTAAQVVDAEAALLLVKAAGAALEVGGQPSLEAVNNAVDQLKETKAYLFKAETDGYKGLPSTAGGNPTPDDTRATAALEAMRQSIFKT